MKRIKRRLMNWIFDYAFEHGEPVEIRPGCRKVRIVAKSDQPMTFSGAQTFTYIDGNRT